MDRRLVVTVAIAGALHAALWAVVRPYERAEIAPPEPPEPTEVVVELAPPSSGTDEPGSGASPQTAQPVAPPTSPPGTPQPSPQPSEPPPKVAVRPGPPAAGEPGTGVPSPSEPVPAPTAEPAPPVPAPAPQPSPDPGTQGAPPIASADPSKPKIPPLIDLGSPGKHAIILPQPQTQPGSGQGKADVPMTPEEAAAKKLDAELKASLDAKDAAKGSNFGGPVASAAHGASLGSHAPQVGWATFDVFTDAAGNVTGVKVMDFNVDPQGWAEVAKRIQAALASKKLQVPGDANGVHVRVRVEASMRLPSGATKGVTLSKKGMGIDFDLADIGSSKTRVVTVRVIGEGRI